jgi:hypothetical protein
MDALTVVAAIIIVLLIFLGIFVFVDLAAMPGRIARKREHSHPEAVNIMGIVGMLVGGVLWPVALTWAFFTPGGRSDRSDELDARIASLEEKLALFEAGEAKDSK